MNIQMSIRASATAHIQLKFWQIPKLHAPIYGFVPAAQPSNLITLNPVVVCIPEMQWKIISSTPMLQTADTTHFRTYITMKTTAHPYAHLLLK